jgi:DNA-binding response OmpR family regulator
MDERWRVLVVDDDKDVLDLIRLKLANEYDVLCIDQANDVSHAVELFEPDLIILDIMLPKISGYQVLEFLKRNPLTAKTPVCFLSAKASARDLKYGYGLGAALYLTKPFQPDRLIRNVKLLFERTPPAHQRKRFTVAEINQRYESERLSYFVATAGAAEAPPREPPKPERPATPLPVTPPPEEEDEEDKKKLRARWVD